jgi:hypothetical protein
MTVFAGFLYQHLGHGVFWVMALVALPAMLFAQSGRSRVATIPAWREYVLAAARSVSQRHGSAAARTAAER